MRLPAIRGIIRRRILVNFRVDPQVMQAQLPARFTPKMQGHYAVAGICLIRLEQIRPQFLPPFMGISSENAAHRVAVTWETTPGNKKEGVFIPRRDTGSLMNSMAGGRLFPGEHHRADFTVREGEKNVDLQMRSRDGTVAVRVRGHTGGTLPESSCFSNIEAASRFFEPGAIGYSVTAQAGRLDGIELRTEKWRVEPLQIDEVYSSYFEDAIRFPKGSIAFDCALMMRNIAHEWHTKKDLYV